MEPVIGKGALVIVDSRPAGAKSGLYLVAVGDELLPRRVTRLPSGVADLVADADSRWRYTLPSDPAEAPELYRIVWSGRAF